MYTRLIFTRGLKEAFVLHFQFVLRSAEGVFGVGCERFSSKNLEKSGQNWGSPYLIFWTPPGRIRTPVPRWA